MRPSKIEEAQTCPWVNVKFMKSSATKSLKIPTKNIEGKLIYIPRGSGASRAALGL